MEKINWGIIGCGDVALRMVGLLRGRYRLYALSHSTERHALLRGRGIIPMPGDLDQPTTLSRLAGLSHDIVHSAPPPATGTSARVRICGRRSPQPVGRPERRNGRWARSPG